jgi:Sulfotransferase family
MVEISPLRADARALAAWLDFGHESGGTAPVSRAVACPASAVPGGPPPVSGTRQASGDNGRPFFILGSGRSGTSLLSRMLNQHPNLAVPPESHLYNTFHPWLGYYGNLAAEQNRANLVADIVATGPLRDWLPRLEADEVLVQVHGDDFGAVVDAVMRAWAAKQGKKRWGEKTPHHIRYWRHISADFKRPPLIHVVRDGRDVAISMMKARFGPKTIYSCAEGWRAYLEQVDKVKSKQPTELFFAVAYEDLLENPKQTLKDVCNFLGEAYAPEMLDYYRDTAPYPTDVRNRENLAKPVIVDNKQKWRTEMSKDEVRVFEAVAGDALANYGYPRAIDDPVMSKAEKWFRRYVEAPYRRSIGRFKDRKGQKERLILVGLLSRRVGLAAVGRLASRGPLVRFGAKDSVT